jgi:hypothetical protein
VRVCLYAACLCVAHFCKKNLKYRYNLR